MHELSGRGCDDSGDARHTHVRRHIQRDPTLSAGGTAVLAELESPPGALGWLVTIANSPNDLTTTVERRWPGSAGVKLTSGTHSGGSPTLRGRTTFISAPFISIEGKSTDGGTVALVAVPIFDVSEIPPGAAEAPTGFGPTKNANAAPATWSAVSGASAVRMHPTSLGGAASIAALDSDSSVLWAYTDDPSKINTAAARWTWFDLPSSATLSADSGGTSQTYRPLYRFPLSAGSGSC